MCDMPKEIIRDPDLVVQIERNFYSWENAAPMIMSYLVFKQPLPPDQIGQSLNEQMLRHDPHGDSLLEKRINKVFDLCEMEYDNCDDDSCLSEEMKDADRMRRKGAFIHTSD